MIRKQGEEMAKRKRPIKKTMRRKRPASKTNEVSEGIITVVVKGGKLDGKTLEMDATMVKLTAETLEREHNLSVVKGFLQPTPQFAMALSKQLGELGYESTPTIALHVWAKASAYFAEQQKKTS